MAQIPKHVFYVNEGFSKNKPHHEYPDLQSVIDEVGADEKVMIRVSSDLNNVPELSLTNPRTYITIDCMEHFEITFQDTICRIRDDHILKFMNTSKLLADDIVMRGNNANLIFKDIDSSNINITLNSGSDNVLMMSGVNFKDVDAAVIDIINRDCEININNSHLIGGVHSPAIWYHAPNNIMTIKNSTLIHGDGIGLPIQVNGSFVPELKLFGCSGASRLCDGTVTNWVVNDNSISNSYIG